MANIVPAETITLSGMKLLLQFCVDYQVRFKKIIFLLIFLSGETLELFGLLLLVKDGQQIRNQANPGNAFLDLLCDALKDVG